MSYLMCISYIYTYYQPKQALFPAPAASYPQWHGLELALGHAVHPVRPKQVGEHQASAPTWETWKQNPHQVGPYVRIGVMGSRYKKVISPVTHNSNLQLLFVFGPPCIIYTKTNGLKTCTQMARYASHAERPSFKSDI